MDDLMQMRFVRFFFIAMVLYVLISIYELFKKSKHRRIISIHFLIILLIFFLGCIYLRLREIIICLIRFYYIKVHRNIRRRKLGLPGKCLNRKRIDPFRQRALDRMGMYAGLMSYSVCLLEIYQETFPDSIFNKRV